MNLFIPVILGTAREGRKSEAAARYVIAELTKVVGVDTELIDVRDFLKTHTIRQDEEHAGQDALAELIQRSDGYVIVSPEYNHGYPGELKILLDTFYDEYEKKPVAICGVGGVMAGGLMVEQLRLIVIKLGMVPTRSAVYFSTKTMFNKEGAVDNVFGERLAKLFEELVWYANVLKAGRS